MIKVWDVESRQCLRTLAAKGPISNVIVLYKPLSMAEGRGSRGKNRLQTFLQRAQDLCSISFADCWLALLWPVLCE